MDKPAGLLLFSRERRGHVARPVCHMNNANPILINWRKEQKVFNQNLSLLQKKLEKEAIHDLRVAIKKLRAYLELYSQLKKVTDPVEAGQPGLLDKTEELFDTIGRQRDVEICLEVLTSFKEETNYSYPQLTLYLQAVLKITKAWSNQEIHGYKNKETKKIAFVLKQDNEIENTRELNQYIQSIIRHSAGETKSQFKKPHLLRKNLKSVYYWINIVNDNSEYHPELLHNILDDLGSWQDKEIALQRIKHFRKDYLPKSFDEYNKLKELEQYIDEKKSMLIKEACNKTRKWIKTIPLS